MFLCWPTFEALEFVREQKFCEMKLELKHTYAWKIESQIKAREGDSNELKY